MEGRHVGRDDTLAELAAEVGLDPVEVRQVLADERYLPAVRADVEQARRRGIKGVPFFVIDGRYGVFGAQSAEVFASALARVLADRRAGTVAS
jgi:predicted DsbA family dithiol-disulfide isomerase